MSLVRQRKIIHVDMDAFFASVEQRDRPELRGKPVVVGGQPNSRGVVAACSYEARKFGIHSAMPSSRAYRLCPDAIFVPTRIEAYREVSTKIQEIFWRYATEVEPLSLDEAYLDVSHATILEGSATRIAQAIKDDIQAETGLIASAGVSYNKFLAKMASDVDKPDGLYVIKPDQGAEFVVALAVGKFYGVGPATEAKMHRLGIKTGADLKAWSAFDLTANFGKAGDYYYHIARGIDLRPVRSSRVRKSLGKETTFVEDINDIPALIEQLNALAEKVFQHMDAKELQARTLTLKVKYANFQQVTRSLSRTEPIKDLANMQTMLIELLSRTETGPQAVRLVGVTASGFMQNSDLELEQQLEFDLNLPGQ
jgi:DNA polymerase-4